MGQQPVTACAAGNTGTGQDGLARQTNKEPEETMKRYLLISLCALGLSATANAATPGPEDLQAIGNNLGPTADALLSGLGDTANTLISTQSAVQTSAALGTTVANTANAAIAGAPNLAAFSLVTLVGNNAVQSQLKPYLTAIDDPTSANIQAALAPEDVNTIAQNLESTPRAFIEGDGDNVSGGPDLSLRQAGIDLLQGNLTEGLIAGVIPKGGAFFEGAQAFRIGIQNLVAGTNLDPAGQLVALGALVGPVAADPVLEQLQDPAQQFAAAGAPLTDPVVGILQAGF